MPDRRRPWLWAAVGLGGFLLAVVLLVPRGQPISLDQRLSTLRTTPDGAGALYSLMRNLGVPTSRRMTPLDGPAPLGRALVLLAPTEPLTVSERDTLVDWVRAGGTLVAGAGFGDPLLDSMGVALVPVGGFHALAVRTVPGPWTTGVDSLARVHVAFDVSRSSPLEDVQPLALLSGLADTVTSDVVVLRARWGDGHVVLFSDPWMLSNGRIADGGAAALFARAAADAVAGGGVLQFDEYHHGHRGGSPAHALFAFLATRRPGWLMLQLLAVLLLAAAPAAVRFGAPLVASASQRRSPLEHVAALGEVYRQARASDLARRRLLVGFARRLGRERPSQGDELAFLERLGRGAPAGASAVAAVAQGWQERVPVVELAARIDEALNRLKGTT
ncbi:MAG: DUF4350 domain-containing protein [Gemmatimonadota bacterium]|jgi:hypothetical protein